MRMFARNDHFRSFRRVNNRVIGAVRSLGLVNPGAWANAAVNCVEGAIGITRPKTYPVELDIILTKACNLRCVICIAYGSIRGERWMPFERYEKIADKLFPHARGVFFCSGGEPFLYPRIRDALRLVRRHRALATVTSNGMLINREIADWIVEDQTIFELFISFDGATKASLERIRRGANFETILRNVEYLNKVKRERGARFPQLSMRYVAVRSNAEELPTLFEICGRCGVDRVEVVYLNVANDIDFDESLFNHPQLAADSFGKAAIEARKSGVQLDLPALPDCRVHERKCVYPWRFCQIDTDGSLRFCYHSWRQRLGFFEDGFDEIWRGPHYQKIRETLDSDSPYYPHCAVCSVRRGMGIESSHKKDFASDSYVIAGLEHLQVPFTERSLENVSSFKEIQAARSGER
jgi:MoaA/NifB/PqqE/SkfB family radical SAM enzyme